MCPIRHLESDIENRTCLARPIRHHLFDFSWETPFLYAGMRPIRESGESDIATTQEVVDTAYLVA